MPPLHASKSLGLWMGKGPLACHQVVFCGIAGEMISTPRAVYNYARYRSKSSSSTIKLKNTNFVSLTTGRLSLRGCVHDGKNVQILSSGNRYEPTFTIHHQHKYIYKTIRRLVASDNRQHTLLQRHLNPSWSRYQIHTYNNSSTLFKFHHDERAPLSVPSLKSTPHLSPSELRPTAVYNYSSKSWPPVLRSTDRFHCH